MRKTAKLATTLYLLVFTTSLSFSQSKSYKKAQKSVWSEATFFFDHDDYETAYKLYKSIYEFDEEYTEINFKLGICCLNLESRQDEAWRYFEIAKGSGSNEAPYWLGIAYHRDGKFDKAKRNLLLYKQKSMKLWSDSEIERRIDIARRAISASQKTSELELNALTGLNTPQNERNPFCSKTGDSLVFESNGKVFLSLMSEANYGSPQEIPFEKEEGWFYSLVGASNSLEVLLVNRWKDNHHEEELFILEYEGGKWQNLRTLGNVVNSPSHESSACISPSGKVIYFSSDRAGGAGGSDIWRVKKTKEGNWSNPSNVGVPVNTPHNEDTPYISADGRSLFFASDAHETLGGFDIFQSVFETGRGWSEPKNLGFPINSCRDDLFFSVSGDGAIGYFSSSREGGKGGMDLYSVDLKKAEELR